MDSPHWQRQAIHRNVRAAILDRVDYDRSVDLGDVCDAVARDLKVSRFRVRLVSRSMIGSGSLLVSD